MSLVNIVSGIINKEPKVDRKKIAYLFKDYNASKPREYSLGLLLRVLNPETITILSVQKTPIDQEPDTKVDRITAMVNVLLPDTKVVAVYGELTDRSDINSLVFMQDQTIAKDRLMETDLGLYFDTLGNIFVYKGDYVPNNVNFFINDLNQEGLEELRDADLDVLLPTENMWLVNELTRNREAEIMIYHFPESHKRDTIKQITSITSAILNSSIRATIEVVYCSEDFAEWDNGKETAELTTHQYDYVLALRGDRIDIHLPFDNGHLRKEPNGWLLLN